MKLFKKNNKYYVIKRNNGIVKYYGISSEDSNILYQPLLDGAEQITTMSGQKSPHIANNTLTGYINSSESGSGYLSQGWDNTGLWELTFKGRITGEGSGIILVCDSTQRDNNLINISATYLWRYNGSSGSNYSYYPSVESSEMRDITITKIDSTTITIKIDNDSAGTISGFTPLSQTNRCYIGVDYWAFGAYAIISDILVTKV